MAAERSTTTFVCLLNPIRQTSIPRPYIPFLLYFIILSPLFFTTVSIPIRFEPRVPTVDGSRKILCKSKTLVSCVDGSRKIYYYFRMLAQSYTPNLYTPPLYTVFIIFYYPFTIVLHNRLNTYPFRAARTYIHLPVE